MKRSTQRPVAQWRRRWLAGAAALLLSPVLADEAPAQTAAPARAAAARPNLVLFIADDMSREDAHVYGSPDAKTPNIDRMAREGLRFANAFAASPTCTPSRSSMFTGDFPMRHGAHANHSPIHDGIATLPAILAKQGYRVVIAGKTDFGERPNFPFEYFPASVFHPPGAKDVLRSALDMKAIDRLLATRDRAKPIALIVASFAPHVRWPDDDGYDAGRLTVPPYLLDTPETRQARTRYLTKVSLADSELGALRGSLAKNGMADDTLLIFTADQGAQFPFAKWNLYDAGIATPLIAVWPGHVPAGKNTAAMVSLVDLLPTMEAAASGPPLAAIDGRSFLPVLLGQTQIARSEIYAAHSGDPNGHGNIAPMRAIRTDHYKLIVNFRPDITFENSVSLNTEKSENSYWLSWVERAKTDPKAAAVVDHFHHRAPVELFDIRQDPYELHNLAGDPAYRQTLVDLRARLNSWLGQQGERTDTVALPSEAAKGHFPYAQ